MKLQKIKNFGFGLTTLALTTPAFASVESSLMAVQSKLIGTILPLVGIVGLAWAALSFFMGSPNARAHLTLAVIGAAVGFGAPAIIDFVRSLVH
jgi:uncharacterized membrane protein YidH (DUF202 family)